MSGAVWKATQRAIDEVRGLMNFFHRHRLCQPVLKFEAGVTPLLQGKQKINRLSKMSMTDIEICTMQDVRGRGLLIFLSPFMNTADLYAIFQVPFHLFPP